ncbi:MAG: EamA family transporter [Micrococcales bacterium]
MLTIVLGLSTALVYGFADFFGALGSRRLRPILVTALAAFGGMSFLGFAVIFLGYTATFDSNTWLWGIIGGIFSAIGLSSLYRALAEGPIAILSPLSAVISAIVPAVIGILQGESFAWYGWLAIALILFAVVLVGFVPGADVRMPSASGLFFGVMAGLGIGVVLIAFHEVKPEAGLGAVIILRAINGLVLVGTALVLILSKKASLNEFRIRDAKFWIIVLAAGVCDAVANVLFTTAVHLGSFTVISVLTALYPTGTILLALLVLKEKVAVSQLVGIGLALGACVLLAI